MPSLIFFLLSELLNFRIKVQSAEQAFQLTLTITMCWDWWSVWINHERCFLLIRLVSIFVCFKELWLKAHLFCKNGKWRKRCKGQILAEWCAKGKSSLVLSSLLFLHFPNSVTKFAIVDNRNFAVIYTQSFESKVWQSCYEILHGKW